MKKPMRLFVPLVVLSTLLLSACSGSAEITVNDGGGGTEIEASGFVEGLVDGFISPFTGLASLFDSGVNVYDDNRGSGYTLGFVLGLVVIILLLMGLFTGGRRYYARSV